MKPFAKVLWLGGVVLEFFLLAGGITAVVLSGFGSGGGWHPAFLGVPGAILLGGLLWSTFRYAFPDRWP